MGLIQQSRKALTALVLVLVLAISTACTAAPQVKGSGSQTAINGSINYQQIETGNTVAGQDFGAWVVQTAKGMVKDAYVRDNNKLGVVIASQVRPNEVQQLAKSLAQGFHKNFPNQDLTVLMYAPDKKLIMSAQYDVQSNQIQYKGA